MCCTVFKLPTSHQYFAHPSIHHRWYLSASIIHIHTIHTLSSSVDTDTIEQIHLAQLTTHFNTNILPTIPIPGSVHSFKHNIEFQQKTQNMKFDNRFTALATLSIMLPTSVDAFSVLPGNVKSSSSSSASTSFTTKLYETVEEKADTETHFLRSISTSAELDSGIVIKESSPSPELKPADFPQNYKISDKWFYLEPKQKVCDTKDIPAQVAFQCVNKRGAIAHGRDTELNFDVLTMDENPFRSVGEVFEDLGGMTFLKDITSIKTELLTKGPVVSTSFLLTEAFMSAVENAARFDPTLVGQKYPVLIVGWEHTAFGEVWLIQPLIKGQYVEIQKIAFRQFGIDDVVVAPLNNFDSTPWQGGPYFDIDLSGSPFPDWCTTWQGVETNINSKDLEKLGAVLSEDFITASRKRTRFVIRDSTKIAHSRACYLTKVEYQEGDTPWHVEVNYGV